MCFIHFFLIISNTFETFNDASSFELLDSIRFNCMLVEIYQLLRLPAILPLPFYPSIPGYLSRRATSNTSTIVPLLWQAQNV